MRNKQHTALALSLSLDKACTRFEPNVLIHKFKPMIQYDETYTVCCIEEKANEKHLHSSQYEQNRNIRSWVYVVCVQVIDMWLSLLVQPIAIQIQLNRMDDRARARALAYVVCLGVQTIVVRLLPGFRPQCRNYRHVYRWANKTLAMPVHCANVYKFAIMDSVNDKYGTEPRARARSLARSLVCVCACISNWMCVLNIETLLTVFFFLSSSLSFFSFVQFVLAVG